jgi:hypothetical protein
LYIKDAYGFQYSTAADSITPEQIDIAGPFADVLICRDLAIGGTEMTRSTFMGWMRNQMKMEMEDLPEAIKGDRRNRYIQYSAVSVSEIWVSANTALP